MLVPDVPDVPERSEVEGSLSFVLKMIPDGFTIPDAVVVVVAGGT